VSNHEKLNTKDICRFVLDASRSHRECARALCVSATTVAKYRNLMRLHRIDLEKLNGLSVVEVEEFVQARYKGGSRNFVVPDWSRVIIPPMPAPICSQNRLLVDDCAPLEKRVALRCAKSTHRGSGASSISAESTFICPHPV
jgi:hypothetical protein